MKLQLSPLASLGAALIMTLPPSGGGVLFAQNVSSLSGSFGFQAMASQLDSVGSNGGAVIGILNFDGAGGVTGTYTLKTRTGQSTPADTATGSLTGTYSTNPDGTGLAMLNFDAGFSASLSLVITDGGQTIQFADVSTGVNTNITLQGGNLKTLNGTLPISYFISGATGFIPFAVASTVTDGIAVYTSVPATGSGTLQCSDGTAGQWTASMPSVSVTLNDGPMAAGDFLAAVFLSACGSSDFETISGFASLNPTPTGFSMVLRAPGLVINGFAKSIGSSVSAPNGSYGFHLTGEPFPAASIGVVNFDGAGNVTASFNNTGVATKLAGTYTTNPDGSGTISLKGVTNPASSISWSFVTADGGATLFILRVDGGGSGASVISGSARLQ